MRKIINRSKTWAILVIILLSVASVSPAFAVNTVGGVAVPPDINGNVFTAGFADENVLDANSFNNTFGESSILSDNNVLNYSSSNTINGSSNVLNNSDINTIDGSANVITDSESNTIIGSVNTLSDNSNSNTITGDQNILADNSYSNTITGNRNDLSESYSNTITGNDNTLTNVHSTTIVGSNYTLDDRENILIIGEGIIVEANGATALGNNSQVTAENSVALGADSIADQPNTVSVGSPTNLRRITNVADGIDPTDAVNVRQLDASISQNENLINSTGALAAALTGIMPLDYDPKSPTQIGIGIGGYRGETAVAIGINHYINDSVLFNVGASFGGGENMWRGGLTWRMGKINPRVETQVDKSEVEDLKYQLQQQQIEVQLLKKQVADLIAAQKAK